jgi:broad-specificity NMP kinase
MNILISGTPGTGKTEISNILGKKTGMKVIHISDIIDDFVVGID